MGGPCAAVQSGGGRWLSGQRGAGSRSGCGAVSGGQWTPAESGTELQLRPITGDGMTRMGRPALPPAAGLLMLISGGWTREPESRLVKHAVLNRQSDQSRMIFRFSSEFNRIISACVTN